MKNEFIMVVLSLVSSFIFFYILKLGGYSVNGFEGFVIYSLFYTMLKLECIINEFKK